MSQENVDLALRGYEAFARNDLDAVFELMHPEIEAHDPPLSSFFFTEDEEEKAVPR